MGVERGGAKNGLASNSKSCGKSKSRARARPRQRQRQGQKAMQREIEKNWRERLGEGKNDKHDD